MKQHINTLLLSILIALTLAILALVIIFVSRVADVNAPSSSPATSQIVEDGELSLEDDMIDPNDTRPADGVTSEDSVDDAGIDFVTYTNDDVGFSTQVPDGFGYRFSNDLSLYIENPEPTLAQTTSFLYFAERPAGDRGAFWGDVGAELFSGYSLAEVCERATDPSVDSGIYSWVESCSYTSGNKVGTPMATFVGSYYGFGPEPMATTVYVLPHPSIEGQHIAISSNPIERNLEAHDGLIQDAEAAQTIALRAAQFLEVFVPQDN